MAHVFGFRGPGSGVRGPGSGGRGPGSGAGARHRRAISSRGATARRRGIPSPPTAIGGPGKSFRPTSQPPRPGIVTPDPIGGSRKGVAPHVATAPPRNRHPRLDRGSRIIGCAHCRNGTAPRPSFRIPHSQFAICYPGTRRIVFALVPFFPRLFRIRPAPGRDNAGRCATPSRFERDSARDSRAAGATAHKEINKLSPEFPPPEFPRIWERIIKKPFLQRDDALEG